MMNLPSEVLYQIRHNVVRMLDLILLGDISTECIEDELLYSAPIYMIGNYIQSSTLENNYHCSFNPKNASTHRKLANLKEELIKKGDLKENCL